jgi:Matrixin
MAQGILGVTTTAGEITLIQGWNWYAGADPSAIGAGQYDFQTVVTHEVGHSLGLGHSEVTSSVMFPMLSTAMAHRGMVAADLNAAAEGEGNGLHADPLMATEYAVQHPGGCACPACQRALQAMRQESTLEVVDVLIPNVTAPTFVNSRGADQVGRKEQPVQKPLDSLEARQRAVEAVFAAWDVHAASKHADDIVDALVSDVEQGVSRD